MGESAFNFMIIMLVALPWFIAGYGYARLQSDIELLEETIDELIVSIRKTE